MREHSAIKDLLAKWDQFETTRRQLEDNRELAASQDADLAQMAQEEIPTLERRVADLEFEIQVALLPPDEADDRDAIVEIRAGPAEAKPPSSRPIFIGCITATPRPPV
jgi:peptide chain release factor 1